MAISTSSLCTTAVPLRYLLLIRDTTSDLDANNRVKDVTSRLVRAMRLSVVIVAACDETNCALGLEKVLCKKRTIFCLKCRTAKGTAKRGNAKREPSPAIISIFSLHEMENGSAFSFSMLLAEGVGLPTDVLLVHSPLGNRMLSTAATSLSITRIIGKKESTTESSKP